MNERRPVSTGGRRRLSTVLRTGVGAALLAGLLAVPAAGQEVLLPPSPQVDRPLYSPTRAGFAHFLQDELERLVAGQEWHHRGRHFEVTRVHQLRPPSVTRQRQPNRDYGAPLRGHGKAIIHVLVDGKLHRAQIEANASYVWQPGHWEWETVLVYLGRNAYYDFARREVR